MKFFHWALAACFIFLVACNEETTASQVESNDSSAKAVESSNSDSDALAKVRLSLQQKFPVAKIDAVETTKLPGIYMIGFATGEVLYANEDVSYMLRGELFKVDGPGKITNQTELYLSTKREKLLASVSDGDLITYKPKGESKGDVYVFTDVDCGYCRKFHQEVPRLNELGITVKYLAWPRAGEQSATGKVMTAVWCSADQNDAMTKAKFKEGVLDPAASNCKTPIANQLQLGRQLGVRGTPAIFLKDGKQVGGYRPADDLAKEMGIL